MKQDIRYLRFLKSVACLLIIGQLWAHVVSHCHWVADGEAWLIERCLSEANEAEEGENQEEKDQTLQIDSDAFYRTGARVLATLVPSWGIPSLHHPEIHTPPPERLFS